ncbi:MAG: type IV toxin-antitoxin system AbiEi family antitoxin domain-containing protein, partial [Solirubrobacteraceae bacterium]
MFRRRQRPTPESQLPPSDVAITETGQRRNASRRSAPSDVDARIAALAGAQDGMITRAQLLALPLSPGAIDGRVRAGRLHPRFRGIYAVGHAAVSPRGRLRAGLLATGDD